MTSQSFSVVLPVLVPPCSISPFWSARVDVDVEAVPVLRLLAVFADEPVVSSVAGPAEGRRLQRRRSPSSV